MLFIGGLLKLGGRNYIKIMAQIIAGRLLQKVLFTVYHSEEGKERRGGAWKCRPNSNTVCTLIMHMEYLHMAPEKYH